MRGVGAPHSWLLRREDRLAVGFLARAPWPLSRLRGTSLFVGLGYFSMASHFPGFGLLALSPAAAYLPHRTRDPNGVRYDPLSWWQKELKMSDDNPQEYRLPPERTNETSQNKPRQNEPKTDRAPRGQGWDTASASAVLRGMDDRHRTAIAAAYKRRGGRFTSWTYENYIALEAAIFETENELEHRGARNGCSDVEPVCSMRARRVALEALVGDERSMLVVSDSLRYASLQRSRP